MADTTATAAGRDLSAWVRMYNKHRLSLGVKKAELLVYTKANMHEDGDNMRDSDQV